MLFFTPAGVGGSLLCVSVVANEERFIILRQGNERFSFHFSLVIHARQISTLHSQFCNQAGKGTSSTFKRNPSYTFIQDGLLQDPAHLP
jgi:hypothetical protein